MRNKAIYETSRLYAREMRLEDLPVLQGILQDPEVMTAYEGPFTTGETLGWLKNQLDRYAAYGFGLWAVCLKDSDEMIGQCGLTTQEFCDNEVLEIGYLFLKKHWNRGYAIEAALGAKKYAFEVLGAEEVYSIIRDTNIRSINVAIKNGMAVRGICVRHCKGADLPHYGFAAKRESS